MGRKGFIYLFVFIGGSIGGYIPTLWGASVFDFISIIGGGIGSILGIWAGYKISQRIGG